MTDAIILKARELAVESKLHGHVVERALLNGAYDKGTLVTRWLPDAERLVLANREEANDE